MTEFIINHDGIVKIMPSERHRRNEESTDYSSTTTFPGSASEEVLSKTCLCITYCPRGIITDNHPVSVTCQKDTKVLENSEEVRRTYYSHTGV